jgi:hypothetical protein
VAVVIEHVESVSREHKQGNNRHEQTGAEKSQGAYR